MRTSAAILLVLLTAAAGTAAQPLGVLLGADASYTAPAGSFAKRSKPALTYRLTGRETHYNNPRWGGYVEYARFEEENRDRLSVKRLDTLNGVPRELVFPLKPFDMVLTSYGAGVTMNYAVVTTPAAELSAYAAFGIHYWEFDRASYVDSIRIDTGSVAPKLKLLDVLRVPELHQKDWSGALHVGLDADITLFSPVILTAGVRYRILLAELWPTLEMDLENVSGIQSVSVSVGLQYLFE